MANHLLLPLDNLYRLFNNPSQYFRSKDYYMMTCFPSYHSLDIDIISDVFNSLSLKQLQNFNRHLFRHWSHVQQDDSLQSCKDTHSRLTRSFDHSNIHSLDELNQKLSNFIQMDPILSLYCINQIIIYVYPI